MDTVKPAQQPTKPETKPKEAQSRVSGSGYPYFDLESSIEVVKTINDKGGGACDNDQLAPWLGYTSVNSGTYSTRLSSARYFGLILNIDGRITITNRAKSILAPVMAEDTIAAKADAFLSVPLYSKVYEQFRGGPLPPEVGLINLFKQTHKILPERASNAVKVFLRSAEQAGFFKEGGRNRLVRPALGSAQRPAAIHAKEAPDTVQATATMEKPKFAGGGGGGDGIVHSALIALLRDLPAPGTPWEPHKKKKFLTAFEAMIEFIYPGDDGGKGEAGNA